MLRGVAFGPIRLKRYCDVKLRNIGCEGHGWQLSNDADMKLGRPCKRGVTSHVLFGELQQEAVMCVQQI